MKNSLKFVVAAVALGFLASANAGVILQSTTQITKKKILVTYQQAPTGVLQSMQIKQKRLARWCRRNGGCSYALVYGNGSVVPSGVEGGNQLIAVTPPQPVPVPEPATLALLGAGLLGMGLSARRRRNNIAA